jgi:hypothetical protein
MTEHLKVELNAFKKQQAELERHYMHKFVIFHGEEFAGAFDTFDAAAREAIKRFGLGPYLIRQVGRINEMPMPASIAFRPVHVSG